MIEQARRLCMRLIEMQGEAKLSAITEHLTGRGLSNLSGAHVQQLLSTLVLDGYVRPLSPACSAAALCVVWSLQLWAWWPPRRGYA